MPQTTKSSDAAGSLRRIRWAQWIVFALVGLALAATAVQSFRGARRAAESVTAGQGQALLHAVRRGLPRGGPIDAATLERLLRPEQEAGLLCIAVLEPGRRVVRAGDCTMSDADFLAAARDARPDDLLRLPGRVALIQVPPGPPGPPGLLRDGGGPHGVPERHPPGWPPRGRRPPPDDERPFAADERLRSRDGRPPRGDEELPRPERPPRGLEAPWRDGPPLRGDGSLPPRGRPPRPGPLLIEFAPLEATALEDVTRASLVTALGALVALLVGALALSRLARRAESLQIAMERQRQLASLGEISAVLAHEIRNPLAAIKGHAQLLLESLAPAAREHANAERVVREATRLEGLTEDLLSLVRSGRIDAVRADPLAVLRAAATSVDGTRIDVVAHDVPVAWRLDPERMRQVLENLLRNALEASPEPERVEAHIGVEDGELVIAVRDRGVGLPPGEEGRIFEPFFTTRARGTGLGLAVARRIVELHGGSISARNADGGGAEMRVVLP